MNRSIEKSLNKLLLKIVFAAFIATGLSSCSAQRCKCPKVKYREAAPAAGAQQEPSLIWNYYK